MGNRDWKQFPVFWACMFGKKENFMPVKKITMLALYTALALILFTIESALPALAPLPFIKLGLANIITLMVLVLYSPRDAFLVLMVRVCLSSLIGGQIVYLFYSLAGGVCCFFADVVVNKILKGKYVYITSVFGAVFHNIGQMLVAVLLMGVWVLPYFPYLMISAVITGLFTGIAANVLIIQLKNI